jgi:hypothetical protein
MLKGMYFAVQRTIPNKCPEGARRHVLVSKMQKTGEKGEETPAVVPQGRIKSEPDRRR